MTEKLLLEVIILLLVLFTGLLGYLARRHDAKHDELIEKIEDVRKQRETCMSEFADHEENKASHVRIFNKIDNLSIRIVRVEAEMGIKHEL